jgi:hypothetical protein
MAHLYGWLVAEPGQPRPGGIPPLPQGAALLPREVLELGRRELSRGVDPLSGRPLRFGVGFELAGTPSTLGPAPDAFGHTGSGGSSHGGWPSLRAGFSFVTAELRLESRDSRARTLLATLHRTLAA